MLYLLCPDSKLCDPYIHFNRLDEGFILAHLNSWFDLILMLFWILLCLIDEIMSKISQNDLHVLHNNYTYQICKIIGVNIELVILAFILLALDHANFECQHSWIKFLLSRYFVFGFLWMIYIQQLSCHLMDYWNQILMHSSLCQNTYISDGCRPTLVTADLCH